MNTLCYLDGETTGLDPALHQMYEVSWWLPGHPLMSMRLPHTLENADSQALEIGQYHERGFKPIEPGKDTYHLLGRLAAMLDGVTIVGANPGFDISFLRKIIGTPWHYRTIDVESYAMPLLDLDRPVGLNTLADILSSKGYEIHKPDHTAQGDVQCVRDVHEALIQMKNLRTKVPIT